MPKYRLYLANKLIKTFTPSMPQDSVAELDRRRGFGDYGKISNPQTDVVFKQPWKIKTPVNKLDDERTDRGQFTEEVEQPMAENSMGKAIDLLKSFSKGISEWDIKQKEIKQDMAKKPKPSYTAGSTKPPMTMKARPYPRVDIDDKQGLVRREGAPGSVPAGGAHEPHFKDKPPADWKGDPKGVVRKLKDPFGKSKEEEDETPYDEAQEGEHSETLEHADKDKTDKAFGSHVMSSAPRPTAPNVFTSAPHPSGQTPPSMAHTTSGGMNTSAPPTMTPQGKRAMAAVPVSKALNSRSLYIPRPLAPYDPYQVYRSATTVVTRESSNLRAPEGVAPLVGDTLEEAAHRRLTEDNAFKSCEQHGTLYKGVCGPCLITKSGMCNKCGTDLMKTKGGTSMCRKCGE